jgi:hypothetical protein
MPKRSVIELAKAYWQKRLVRILIALLVLGGAVYAEYRLAHIALPVEVESSKPAYTPVQSDLIKREVLVIKNPSPQPAGQSPADGAALMLLADEGSDAVTVEAHFESALLDDDIMSLLRRENKPPLPPADARQIAYTTEGQADESEQPAQPDENARPCRTSIHVSLASNAKLPSELSFFQLKGPGADRYRNLEMKATGADLVVQLLTRNAAANRLGKIEGPGCTKTLSVGDWSRTTSSPVPLKIVVPAGTSFQFWFTPLGEKPAWSGTAGLFEAFELEATPLRVHGVDKISYDAPSAVPAFSATSLEGHPLLLRHLLIGSGELQLDYAGQAMVQENGKYAVTFSLLEFAKGNPILAGILAMLDAALLEWVRRALFKWNKSSD